MHRYNEYDEKGKCECCGTEHVSGRPDTRASQHHVYPRRYNFKNELRHKAIWLCLKCHGEFEELINRHESMHEGQLPTWMYAHITLKFITNQEVFA